MAMSKDELIGMINSTIYENESKAITGASLNLALNAIVEAMGTTGGGSGVSGNKYYIPTGMIEANSSDSETYTFSTEETVTFFEALDTNAEIYMFMSVEDGEAITKMMIPFSYIVLEGSLTDPGTGLMILGGSLYFLSDEPTPTIGIIEYDRINNVVIGAIEQ